MTLNVPSWPVTGLVAAVPFIILLTAGGGPTPDIETVTGLPGANPLPCTTNVVLALPVDCTMQTDGRLDRPELDWPELDWPDEAHEGGGGGELPLGGGVLELVSDAPRMTPPTTRAAPTVIQPIQARRAPSHRRQPAPARAGWGRGGL